MPETGGIDEDEDGTGDGYFYLSYYDQSLSKPETLDFDVSGSEGRSSRIVNACDYMPSQELNMVSSTDPLQTANVFTAECDQLVTTVTTETSTPYTSMRYEVYLLDDNATNPTDGMLAASTSDTYQYGGFHRTNLECGVVVREGQKFSVVVTQRTVTGQYQMQAECTIDKEGAEAIKEISGINMPTYTTGVVNEGEITGDFPDKADVSDWAAPSMAWAVDSGIVHGNNGMLEPLRAITRAELATMLLNAHDAGL